MAARRGVRLTRSGGTVIAGHYVTTPSGVTITHSGRADFPDQMVIGGALTAGSGILAGTTITAGTTIAAGTDIQVGGKIDLGSGTFLKYEYGSVALTTGKANLSSGTVVITTTGVTVILGMLLSHQLPKGVTHISSGNIDRISWEANGVATSKVTVNLSLYDTLIGTYQPVTAEHKVVLSGNTLHWFVMGT